MDVAWRPARFEEELRRYFRLLAEEEYGKAGTLRRDLERQIGDDDPIFVRADMLLKRKEILGK
jgi:hypothetical protein